MADAFQFVPKEAGREALTDPREWCASNGYGDVLHLSHSVTSTRGTPAREALPRHATGHGNVVPTLRTTCMFSV